MMKSNRFSLVIVLLFSFFFVATNVEAGVCANKYVTPSSGYCQFGKTYTYSYGTKFAATSSGGGWMGYPYVVGSGSSISGATEYGFCLDPGLKSPTDGVGYDWAREIKINDTSSYDFKVYKAYQKYVNAIAYDRNTGAYSDANKNRYLGYTDVSLRVFTIEAGFDIDNDITEESRRFKQFKNIIYPYVHDGTALSGYDSSYWGSETHLANAKAYYDGLKNMGSLWNNPLKIETKSYFDTDTRLYNFEFEIKLTNSTSQYFADSSTGLANGDYDIGYGNAYLSYKLKINDGAYALTNASNYTGNSWIDKSTANANSTKTAILQMTKDTYDSIVAQSGKVVVSLEYETYHPMSSDNVFLNFKNNRTSDADVNYQRMVVFSKYVKKGKINSDGTTEIVHNYNVCSQEGSRLKYGENTISIQEYINKCGCPNLSDSHGELNSYQKSYYFGAGNCAQQTTHEYGSTLKSCSDDNSGRTSMLSSSVTLNSGENEIFHIHKEPVQDNNRFCNIECTEDIKVKSYTQHFTVKAGQYFELNAYPEINSNKSCTVNVNYNDWKNEYNLLLRDEIAAINKRLYDYAVNHPTYYKTVTCSCGEECTTSGTVWKYTYTEYYLARENDIRTYSNTGYYRTGNCGNTKPRTNSDTTNEGIVDIAKRKLEDHKTKLQNCNKKLLNTSDENYYKFNGNLSFYYEQEYSSSVIGKRYNNLKPNGESNDSPFALIPNSTPGWSNGYKEDTSKNYKNTNFSYDTDSYIYLSSSSATSATTGYLKAGQNLTSLLNAGNYTIQRTRYYSASYKPSVTKYKEPLTGRIRSESNKSDLIDPIKLGNVYDTDVSAKAYDSNNNYYEFSSLGDQNSIYEAFTGSNPIKFNGMTNVIPESEYLKRTCTYKITNDVICKDLEMCINYRMVDSREIDPNDRLNQTYTINVDGTTNGFKNWRNVKGETVYNDMKATDTFNPSNLEYSFTLDSKTINNIREYNKTAPYDKIDVNSYLNCNNVGNECESKFVTDLSAGAYGTTVNAKTDGREMWKYLLYSSSRGWYIDALRKGTISETQYNNWINDPSSNYNREGVTP